jgi:hypothetical protein
MTWISPTSVQIVTYSLIHQWLYSILLGTGLLFSFVIFFYADGRTPWTSDQTIARPLPKNRINAHTNIHALSGIRTRDPSVRANKDSSFLRTRGHCDCHLFSCSNSHLCECEQMQDFIQTAVRSNILDHTPYCN